MLSSSLYWDLWSIFSVCPLFPSWPPSQTPTRLQWFVPGCHSDLIPLWLRVLPYRSRTPRGRTPSGTQFFCPGSNEYSKTQVKIELVLLASIHMDCLFPHLNLPVLGELVMDVILLSFLVDPGHEQNPPLDTSLWPGLALVCFINSLILSILSNKILNKRW